MKSIDGSAQFKDSNDAVNSAIVVSERMMSAGGISGNDLPFLGFSGICLPFLGFSDFGSLLGEIPCGTD